VLETISCQERN